MRDILRYNLRSETKFLRVLSSKAWNMVPTEIKNSATLNIFKEKIRKGGGEIRIVTANIVCHTFRILDL